LLDGGVAIRAFGGAAELPWREQSECRNGEADHRRYQRQPAWAQQETPPHATTVAGATGTRPARQRAAVATTEQRRVYR
jgi:hypothetical protein